MKVRFNKIWLSKKKKDTKDAIYLNEKNSTKKKKKTKCKNTLLYYQISSNVVHDRSKQRNVSWRFRDPLTFKFVYNIVFFQVKRRRKKLHVKLSISLPAL